MFFQIVVNSITMGLTYVLMASGLSLVFGIMRIVNFAHGQMYMLGAFVIYYFCEVWGIHYLIAVPAAMIIIGMIGLMIEKFLLRPKADGPVLTSLIITIGLVMIMEGAASLAFGDLDKPVETVFKGKIHLAAFTLSYERLAIIILSVVIISALYVWIQKTKDGIAVRAVSQDKVAAALQGIGLNRVSMIVMSIGCALAAAAGALMAPVFYVNPFIGGFVLFKALIVITLGGMGSMAGAAAGGMILGFIEGFGYTYIGGWADVFAFAAVIVFLIFRPHGLFGVPYEMAH